MSTTNQNKTWVLIGNYPPDHQESMLRFTQMLATGLQQQGLLVKIIQPCVVFGFFARTTQTGFGKWLAYIDKWVLFPILLFAMRLSRKGVWYHICDHSNAPYIFYLSKKRTSLTCHDVLAIQAALGDCSTHIETGKLGHLLQRYILSGLRACSRIGTVSNYTLRNLVTLAIPSPDRERLWRVIPNALNNDFSLLVPSVVEKMLKSLVANPYILHVGSDHPRKNRKALLYLLSDLQGKWEGNVVFAGESLGQELEDLALKLGIRDKVIAIVKPGHDLLNALYNGCTAFVFPSYSEGFGWPLIEAQTCGAPIIANDIPVLREVSGGAALHVAVDDPGALTSAFLQLLAPSFRKQIIAEGLINARKYKLGEMTHSYLQLAQEPLLPHQIIGVAVAVATRA